METQPEFGRESDMGRPSFSEQGPHFIFQSSFYIIKGQYVAISTAYAALSDKFDKYRGNIIDTYGEVADFNAMNDIKTEEVEIKNEKGKTVAKASVQRGEDLRITIDNSWGVFAMCDAGANVCRINAQLGELQRMIEHGAKKGLTIASIIDNFGCPVDYDSLPLEYQVLGYAENECIDYELEYDSNMSHWDTISYSDGTKLKAPPITIIFRNAKPVLCKIDNSLSNEYRENAYIKYLEDIEYEAMIKARELEYGDGVIEEAV